MSKTASVVYWRELFPPSRLLILPRTVAIMAVGQVFSKAEVNGHNVALMLIVTAFWSMLYALNEAVDLLVESSKRVPVWIWAVLIGHMALLLALVFILSPATGWIAALMLLSQVLYTVPGLRVKRFWIPTSAIRGVINPYLRLHAGAVLGFSAVPVLISAIVLLLSFGAYIMDKFSKAERDLELGHQRLPIWTFQLGAACSMLGVLGMYLGWISEVSQTGYPFPILFILCNMALGFALWYWYYIPGSVRGKRWRKSAVSILPALVHLLDKPKEEVRDLLKYAAVCLVLMVIELTLCGHT